MRTASELGQACAIEGPALELGAVVVEGQAHPEARVRMPLSMLTRHGLVARAAASTAGREIARSLFGTAPRRRSTSTRRRSASRRARW